MTAQTQIIIDSPADMPTTPSASSGFVILHGSLSPEGCVMKGSGFDRDPHEAKARVFATESDAIAAVSDGRVASGEAIVIAAADAGEMSAIFSAITAAGIRDIALISNGSFANHTHGITINHVGRAIRYVQNFDTITIDIRNRRLDIDADLTARRNDAPRGTKIKNGFGPMEKYAAMISSATEETPVR